MSPLLSPLCPHSASSVSYSRSFRGIRHSEQRRTGDRETVRAAPNPAMCLSSGPTSTEEPGLPNPLAYCLGQGMMQPRALLQVDVAARAPGNLEKRKSSSVKAEPPGERGQSPARTVRRRGSFSLLQLHPKGLDWMGDIFCLGFWKP